MIANINEQPRPEYSVKGGVVILWYTSRANAEAAQKTLHDGGFGGILDYKWNAELETVGAVSVDPKLRTFKKPQARLPPNAGQVPSTAPGGGQPQSNGYHQNNNTTGAEFNSGFSSNHPANTTQASPMPTFPNPPLSEKEREIFDKLVNEPKNVLSALGRLCLKRWTVSRDQDLIDECDNRVNRILADPSTPVSDRAKYVAHPALMRTNIATVRTILAHS